MSASTAAPTFHALATANRRRSVMLLVSVFVVLTAAGAAIGALLAATAAGAFLALGLAVLIGAGSWFFGNLFVLRSVGAQLLPDEAQYDQFRNVVTEMSLAAGLPMPQLYLLRHPAVNAFATGLDPRRAAIGITTGALEQLDREELQGVVAHEMAHIRNLDTRFALLLATMVGAIALLTQMLLRGALRSTGGRGRKGGAVVFLLVAAAFAAVGWVLVQLISLAAGRQREYLADATAVDLTRNPHGIERALTKMLGRGMLGSAVPGGTAHMFIVAPRSSWVEQLTSWGATHPALPDRVNRLRGLRGAPLLNDEAFAAEHERLAPSRAFWPAEAETEKPQTNAWGWAAIGAGVILAIVLVGSILSFGGSLAPEQVEVLNVSGNTGQSARAHFIYQRGDRFYDGYVIVGPQTKVGDALTVCIAPDGAVLLLGDAGCE